MGINVGAFICNFFGAALQILLGWQYAFMAAGVGMFVRSYCFYFQELNTTENKTEKKGVQPGDMPVLENCDVYLSTISSFWCYWLVNQRSNN